MSKNDIGIVLAFLITIVNFLFLLFDKSISTGKFIITPTLGTIVFQSILLIILAYLVYRIYKRSKNKTS